jgi:uncharacterized membrane protein YbhN (UPF0104 family)
MGSARRRLMLALAAAAAGLALLGWTLRRLGPRGVLDAALAADARWLALSIVPVVARYAIWAVKWQRMLARERAVSLRDATRMVMAGCFVNLTTPTAKLGGALLRAAVLERRHGFELSAALGWVLADQLTNVLGSLLLFGVLALAGGALAPAGGAAGYGAAGVLALLLLAGMLVARAPLGRAAERPRLAAALARWTPARFHAPGREPGAWVRPFLAPLARKTTGGDIAAGALSFAALCVASALALHATGGGPAPWVVAVAVGVGYFAGNGLGPWGGIGVTEAAMAGVYLQLGVSGEAAAAGVLLHRGAYYAVGLGWGGLALARLGRARAARGE